MATVKVLPGKLNYSMVRGDDFAAEITIQEGDPLAPVDVSSRTYTAQIRTSTDATGFTGKSLEIYDSEKESSTKLDNHSKSSKSPTFTNKTKMRLKTEQNRAKTG